MLGYHKPNTGNTADKLAPYLPVVAETLHLAGQFGSSVPFLQGVVEATAKIVERLDSVKRYKKDCARLAELAKSITSTLQQALDGVSVDGIDDKIKKHLFEFEWRLNEIAKTMTDLIKRPFREWFFFKDRYADVLSEHKESLQNAERIFQIQNIIAMRLDLTQTKRAIVDCPTELGRIMSNKQDELLRTLTLRFSIVLFE